MKSLRSYLFIVTLTAFLIFPLAINASDSSGLYPHMDIAFITGATISQHYGVDFGFEQYEVDKGFRAGMNIGLILNYPLSHSFSLRNEVLYVNKGSYQNIKLAGETISFKVSYNTDYLEVPTIMKLNIYQNSRSAFYTLSGFSFAYMLKAKYEIDGTVSLNDDTYKLAVDKKIENIDRFDFNIVYGGGWEVNLNRNKGFFIEYRAAFGIPFIDLPTTEDITIEGNKIDDDPERVKLRNLSYSLSLGYRLF